MLIDLLLVVILKLLLRRRGIVLSRRCRVLLRLKAVPIGVVQLLRRPPLVGKGGNTLAGDICRRALGFILALRFLGLLRAVLILGNLGLDFGCSDLGEKLPGFDAIADIDIALRDIAAGTRINIPDYA